MFKKWQPKKAAIRVRKTYDKVDLPDTYIIKSEKNIEDIVLHIKSHADSYCRNIANEDKLTGIPNLEFNTEVLETVPNEPKIPIKATVHYTLATTLHKKKSLPIIPIILTIIISIVLVSIVMLANAAKAERIHNMCKVYYRHGEATHIMLGDREFDLNNMTEQDYLLMNPWEKELLQNTKISECLRIDRR